MIITMLMAKAIESVVERDVIHLYAQSRTALLRRILICTPSGVNDKLACAERENKDSIVPTN